MESELTSAVPEKVIDAPAPAADAVVHTTPANSFIGRCDPDYQSIDDIPCYLVPIEEESQRRRFEGLKAALTLTLARANDDDILGATHLKKRQLERLISEVFADKPDGSGIRGLEAFVFRAKHKKAVPQLLSTPETSRSLLRHCPEVYRKMDNWPTFDDSGLKGAYGSRRMHRELKGRGQPLGVASLNWTSSLLAEFDGTWLQLADFEWTWCKSLQRKSQSSACGEAVNSPFPTIGFRVEQPTCSIFPEISEKIDLVVRFSDGFAHCLRCRRGSGVRKRLSMLSASEKIELVVQTLRRARSISLL